METSELAQLREMLNKNWMTHDAMWFYHCLQECGIQTTNKLNLAAIDSMARLEAQRYLKVLGLSKVDNAEDMHRFVDKLFSWATADFMDFSFGWEPDGALRIDMGECFAYRGIKRLGVLDHYQCGIYRRVEAWLASLGVDYEVEPRIQGCLKHQGQPCHQTYRFSF